MIHNKNFFTRFCNKIGIAVSVNHQNEKLSFYIKWFFVDWKNNFLLQVCKSNWLFGSTLSIQKLRPMLNRWRGVKIGKFVAISDNTIIGPTYPEDVEIGNHCRISANVIIEEHGRDLKNYRVGMSILDLPVYRKKVIIEDFVHVGVGAIILPGVTIGKGTIIGAGAVVRESVPKYCLVVGNPAKVVYRFPDTK
jgi:acetyltransferase-like isoleucine patch superfamily enzyme